MSTLINVRQTVNSLEDQAAGLRFIVTTWAPTDGAQQGYKTGTTRLTCYLAAVRLLQVRAELAHLQALSAASEVLS